LFMVAGSVVMVVAPVLVSPAVCSATAGMFYICSVLSLACVRIVSVIGSPFEVVRSIPSTIQFGRSVRGLTLRLAPAVGLEPTTTRFGDERSTN
jgi:hypothetical protein